ncbi:MAG: ATP-dependent helicase [Pseudomonadota bacterium]
MIPQATERPARVWSSEQEAIFSWFERDQEGLRAACAVLGLPAVPDAKGHLVVVARAGTGKTTTILEGTSRAPEGRILLAAFNKAIATELQARLQNPACEAKTLHAVGYAAVRRYWERVQIAKGNEREWGLAQEVCGDQVPDAIKRLVGKACTKGREIVPHATEAGPLMDVIVEHELEPDEEWAEAGYGADYVEHRALEAMELAAVRRPKDGIDFADMLYLPVRNKWLVKTYDLVVVDEAQDMTVTQLEIAQGVARGRICVVGDDRQAIYAFRGADSESLGRLKEGLRAGELGLKTTYRCPRVVVASAKRIVPDFEAAPGAPEGTESRLLSLDALVAAAEPKADDRGKPHDLIASRTNAPIAGVAMALIRAGKRVRIQGREFGAGLIGLVKKLSTGKAASSIPALLERLARWEDRELARLEKMGREDLQDGVKDKAETLRVVAEGTTGPRELEARLGLLFADDGAKDTVVCSSVHKAKGLEFRRVFVLRPTLHPALPKGKVRTPKQAIEEANIEYVAVTRAMDALVWVEAK